jgi:PAS domain S-box-containing protein
MKLLDGRSQIEDIIEARTANLSAVNAQLQLEIAHHLQIEDALRHSEELAEAAKHQIERHYEELIDSLEAIVWRADPATLQFTFVSKQAETTLGYPPDQWRVPHFWETHLHPADRLKVVASCRQAIQQKRHQARDYRMIAANGKTVWLHDLVHVIVEQGQTKELIGVMVDITDRKHTETSLIEMTGRLIGAQEEERRRIARELHDDLNQRLALLAIGLERVAHDLAPDDESFAQVAGLRKLTQEISSDIQRLSHRLHPAKLDHLGLVAAINGFCRELSGQHDVHIDFLHRDVPKSIPKDAALCLFRVAQEALSNMVKHSGVRTGRLELIRNRETLHLCVSDAGVGFDPQAVSTKGRLGLISMQERVRTAGGHISIESRPSRGTRIIVQVSI